MNKRIKSLLNRLPLPAPLKTRLRLIIHKSNAAHHSCSQRSSDFFRRRVLQKLKRAAFTLTQWLLNYPSERAIFQSIHGYPLNLRHPRSFNEKIVWKKLHDRNPLLPRVTDKFLVRNYVREKLGAQKAEKILIPLLFHSKDPAAIPFDNLPDSFVIKPNHASGRILIVRNKHEIDRDIIVATCREWLSETHYFFRHEWAYRKIKPLILVEALLLESDGNVPREIKFHMFHGKCKRIVVITGRFEELKQSSFDGEWNYLETETSYPVGPPLPKPANFDEMVELAEKLAQDFDYIRVDLYDLRGRVYFSELTSYTNSGDINYKPTQYDFDLGANWTIIPGYWKKKNRQTIESNK